MHIPHSGNFASKILENPSPTEVKPEFPSMHQLYVGIVILLELRDLHLHNIAPPLAD